MPTYTYAFAGGSTGTKATGDRWQLLFTDNWNEFDYWSMAVTSTIGDFTLGVGNLHALVPTIAMTYFRRVYLGMTSQFNYSDNDDPTAWEEQDPGAGFNPFTGQYGSQDIISGLAVLQGRLAVIGRRSVQMWQVDADPNNFALLQVLDNVGTFAPLSVQQLGDADVLILDDTGVRSLRAKEVTLNAYVDDIGSAVDGFIQDALAGLSAVTAAAACAVVEPKTKNYMLFLKDTIYVLSRHLGSKITAWSTYEPRGSDNVLFTSQKFAVHNGIVYCRSAAGGHYVYGGADNTTYDAHSQVTFQLPWLDDKRPGSDKMFTGIGGVLQGSWTLQVSADPVSNTFTTFYSSGSAATPNTLTDSTFDIGRFPLSLIGTHISIKGVSSSTSTSVPVILGSIIVFYNPADVQ